MPTTSTEESVDLNSAEQSTSYHETMEQVEIPADTINEIDELVQDELQTESNIEEKTERITKLPLSRIKQIMKMDLGKSLASQGAVFLISKSTELFIQTLAKEAHLFTLQNKKKTIQKKDVESAVSNVDCLSFLEGALDI